MQKVVKKIRTARKLRKALHFRRNIKNLFCRKRTKVVSIQHSFSFSPFITFVTMAVALTIGAISAAVSAGTAIADAVSTAKARNAQAHNNDPNVQAKAAENANLDYMGQMDKKLQGLGMPAGIPYLQGAQAPGRRAINGLNFRFSNYENLPQTQNHNTTSNLAYQFGLEGFNNFKRPNGASGTEELMETGF